MLVDKCFVDKSYGFGKAPTGEIVFIHASAVQGAEVLTIGTDAWVQVVNDDARAQGRYRAKRAWGRKAWKAERDKENANKVAQQVKRAAAPTAELAAQSEKKTAAVCDQPLGLDELAGHIEAPNMGAAMMPDPWATYSRASTEEGQPTTSAPPETTNCVPANKGFFNLARGSREGRSRSTTRAPEVTSLIDETLNFFVKATGKDEASMRQRFTNQNREELRRSRDYWKTRAEEEERLQKTKEEAWRLFERIARTQTKDEGDVRRGIHPQNQERTWQQQKRTREGGARLISGVCCVLSRPRFFGARLSSRIGSVLWGTCAALFGFVLLGVVTLAHARDALRLACVRPGVLCSLSRGFCSLAPLLCESSRASDLTLRASPAWASLARFPHSCGMAPHVCSRP